MFFIGSPEATFCRGSWGRMNFGQFCSQYLVSGHEFLVKYFILLQWFGTSHIFSSTCSPFGHKNQSVSILNQDACVSQLLKLKLLQHYYSNLGLVQDLLKVRIYWGRWRGFIGPNSSFVQSLGLWYANYQLQSWWVTRWKFQVWRLYPQVSWNFVNFPPIYNRTTELIQIVTIYRLEMTFRLPCF